MQVSNELEEASQVSGARFQRTFLRITLPLVGRGIMNSFVYTFVDSLRELGGVVLLTTPSALAFTTLLLEFYDSHPFTTNIIAAASVILTLVVVLAIVVLQTIQYFWGRQRGAEKISAVTNV